MSATPESPTIAGPMEDNQALREILGQVALFRAIAAEQYDDVTGSNSEAVTLAAPYERAAEPDAIKTVITNLGATAIRIYEAGALVAVKAQNETWVSPLNGAGAILVDVATGSGEIAIATYIKESAE